MQRPIVSLSELRFLREIAHGENLPPSSRQSARSSVPKTRLANVTAVPPDASGRSLCTTTTSTRAVLHPAREGTLRIGTQEHPIKSGDFICYPPGGTDVSAPDCQTPAARSFATQR